MALSAPSAMRSSKLDLSWGVMCPCRSWQRLQTALAPHVGMLWWEEVKGPEPCCCASAIKSLWFITAGRTKGLCATNVKSPSAWTTKGSYWRKKGKLKRYTNTKPLQIFNWEWIIDDDYHIFVWLWKNKWFFSWLDMFSLQLLLERKNTDVGKLLEETQKSINDLAENINQAKVNSHFKPL